METVRNRKRRVLWTRKLFKDDFERLIQILNQENYLVRVETNRFKYQSVQEFLDDNPSTVSKIELNAFETELDKTGGRTRKFDGDWISIELTWGWCEIYQSNARASLDTYLDIKRHLVRCWPRWNAMFSTVNIVLAIPFLAPSVSFIGTPLGDFYGTTLDLGWTLIGALGVGVGLVLLRKTQWFHLTLVDLNKERREQGEISKQIRAYIVKALIFGVGMLTMWLLGIDGTPP